MSAVSATALLTIPTTATINGDILFLAPVWHTHAVKKSIFLPAGLTFSWKAGRERDSMQKIT